jgi:shikimate kinase
MSNPARLRPVICLWGFMGVGKTTVGRILARQKEARFVDLDEQVEVETGKSIREIFAGGGEASFRGLEMQAMDRILRSATPPPIVVALGGGALVVESARALAKRSAYVVTLEADAAELLERTSASSQRPLLDHPTKEERASAIQALLSKRRRAYIDVHDTLSTQGLDAKEVARRLAAWWQPVSGLRS